MKKLNLYQWMKLDECLMTVSLINASSSGKGPPPHPGHPLGTPSTPRGPQAACAGGLLPPRARQSCWLGAEWGDNHTPQPHVPPLLAAEKALLRSQLDQTALAKKELEENCRKAAATLTRVTQEQERCQQNLLTTEANCESAKTNLELLKHECSSLRSDVSYTFQRVKELVSPYSCSAVHEQLSRLTQRTEGLFLWQQDRESKYVGKSVCNLNVLQCQNNCTREKQELEKRLQDAEKQVKGGQEEKKQLLAEKQKLFKELEEKTKAAVQAGYLKEQLNICLVSKVRELRHRAPVAAPGTLRGRAGRTRGRAHPSFAHPLFLLRSRFCAAAGAPWAGRSRCGTLRGATARGHPW